MKKKIQLTWMWLTKYTVLGILCGIMLKTIGVTVCTSVIYVAFIWHTVWLVLRLLERSIPGGMRTMDRFSDPSEP